jgi:AcrR family transcriptional regulator
MGQTFMVDGGQDSRRRRLPRDERERLILDEAIRFFAEVGFEGQTRALAERLGVTQPLLYRYFPDKEALIERVFDEVYLKHWRLEWEHLLKSRQRPLAERLGQFYREYWNTVFTPEWVRIFMYAGLKGEAVNDRYLQFMRSHVLEPLSIELRHVQGLPPPPQPVDELDLSIAWTLHGAIYHIALRKWVYGVPVPDDVGPLIDSTIRTILDGITVPVEEMTLARA